MLKMNAYQGLIYVLCFMNAFFTTNVSAEENQKNDDEIQLAVKTYMTTPQENIILSNLYGLENSMNIQIKDIHSDVSIVDIQKNGNNANAFAYEWVGIEYTDLNSETVDYMGMGVRHMLLLQEGNNGYEIVGDAYNDEILKELGCISDIDYSQHWDYIFEKNSTCIETFKEEQLSQYTLQPPAILTSSVSYSVANAVNYAHLYCGVAPSSHDDSGVQLPGQHTAYYNPAYPAQRYTDANGNIHYVDCANFVSQCLHAGGIPLQPGVWEKNKLNWISVSDLKNYFTSTLGYTSVYATNNNIFPGNPVYWIDDSGRHIMICTGRNSSGIPVVDAHNSDLYRWKITGYSSSHTLYTIMITQTYTHFYNNGYQYNDTLHWKFCDACKTIEQKGSHVLNSYSHNSTNHWKTCSTCGAKIGSQAHVSNGKYSSSFSSHWMTCTTCGAHINEIGHNYIDCGTYYICRICNYKKSKT